MLVARAALLSYFMIFDAAVWAFPNIYLLAGGFLLGSLGLLCNLWLLVLTVV
jgi:hypothetical protein